MNENNWITSLPLIDSNAFDPQKVALFSRQFVEFALPPVTFKDGMVFYQAQSYRALGYDMLREILILEYPPHP